jgi:hypothetical protein
LVAQGKFWPTGSDVSPPKPYFFLLWKKLDASGMNFGLSPPLLELILTHRFPMHLHPNPFS